MAQNVLLLVASYVFYGWWDARFLLIIAAVTVFTFTVALMMGRCKGKPGRKAWCIAGVVGGMATLCVFKYFDFFASSAASLAAALGWHLDIVMLGLVLPAGISFYTFQTMSYVVDVYRRDVSAERNIVTYATYVAFFPQLVAGPIERAGRMLPIFSAPRRFSYAQSVEGMRRILLGLLKKMVVADNCAETVSAAFASWQTQGSGALALAAVLFTIEIYCDFSGYCDIAVGSAKLLGIELSENFRAPYFAENIDDFWRRWHITLMRWFRDYIYIPLGGGRSHKQRNVFIVFALSGLWHGAAWTFPAWGIYNAALFAPFRRLEKLHLPVWAMRVITFACVVVGFMIFRSASLADFAGYFVRMLSFTNVFALPPSATHAAVALVAASALFTSEYLALKAETSPTLLLASMPAWARRSAYLLIAAAIVAFGAEPSAFIYFQF